MGGEEAQVRVRRRSSADKARKGERTAPAESERGVVDDDAADDGVGRVRRVEIEEETDEGERNGHRLQDSQGQYSRRTCRPTRVRTAAPLRRIGRRPRVSTRYQVGTVLAM